MLSLPTYDYKCEECGSEFELRLRFSDPVDQPCNSCDKVATRQFSAVPIVFKGSGWYVNDYGKKGSSSGKNTNSSETEGTTTESSTETKSSSLKSNIVPWFYCSPFLKNMPSSESIFPVGWTRVAFFSLAHSL